MDQIEIEDVFLTPLKVINQSNGTVLHGMKSSESTFSTFGEAYFSTVNFRDVKGWKKHLKMELNLIVPAGAIKFVLFDDRKDSATRGTIAELEISINNYSRLTVPPGIWMAFQGRTEGVNILLNIASIEHDPDEAEVLPLENNLINYTWN